MKRNLKNWWTKLFESNEDAMNWVVRMEKKWKLHQMMGKWWKNDEKSKKHKENWIKWWKKEKWNENMNIKMKKIVLKLKQCKNSKTKTNELKHFAKIFSVSFLVNFIVNKSYHSIESTIKSKNRRNRFNKYSTEMGLNNKYSKMMKF